MVEAEVDAVVVRVPVGVLLAVLEMVVDAVPSRGKVSKEGSGKRKTHAQTIDVACQNNRCRMSSPYRGINFRFY